MDMYCCGFNGFGQLGAGSNCLNLTPFHLRNVTDVAFAFSTAIIFSDNDIFFSGFLNGRANQLEKLEPPDKGKVLQVSCSSKQVLCVTDVGDCWQYLNQTESWKKLPDFNTVEDEEIASQSDSHLESDEHGLMECRKMENQIVKVSCGEVLNIALDKSGRVYSIPSPLDFGEVKIVDIACGFEHCILLDETGIVYTWGSGTRGQLGHGEPEFQDLPPRRVETLCGLNVVKISAGGWHSAVVTVSGDLYTWGWNNIGQLGFPITKSNLRSANQYKKSSDEIDEEYTKSLKSYRSHDIDLAQSEEEETSSTLPDGKIKRMKLHCSSEDSNALNENKSAYGVEDVVAVAVLAEPWPVDFPIGIDVNVVDVACGNRHTVALLDDGSVWGCGWNAYQQLGRPSHELLYSSRMINLSVPFNVKTNKPVSVHCGAWNTAILVQTEVVN